jgi:putative copper resistance protein D
MSGGLLAWEGLAWELALAPLYVSVARRPSPRGHPWPRYRTAAFLAGLATIALALQSGLAAYDDVLWVHNLQHVLLMMVASPMLALGAPITLCAALAGARAGACSAFCTTARGAGRPPGRWCWCSTTT